LIVSYEVLIENICFLACFRA